jgi:Icc protein
VHVSDTHIGPTRDYARHGYPSWSCADRLVDLVNQLPVQPAFVIHTGDVVTDPHRASYRLAAETFARWQMPVYYVTGNHDRAMDIHRFLAIGPRNDVTPDRHVLSYTFEQKRYRFLVLDARGPASIDPHGILSDDQLALVRREAQPDGPPLTVFLHFPVWPLNSPWMDANMLLLNAAALHEALLPARHRLRGVFHGHTHQSMQIVRDGIVYTSVASTFAQLSAWPSDQDAGLDHDYPPGFNVVTLLPDQTIVRQHTFPRPTPGNRAP